VDGSNLREREALCLQFIHPADQHPPSDLIIVAVEFAHLETAFQDMKSYVGENTIVLSLLCKRTLSPC
jgi:ketopantoate reductase